MRDYQRQMKADVGLTIGLLSEWTTTNFLPQFSNFFQKLVSLCTVVTLEDFGSRKHFLICIYYFGGAKNIFFHNFIGPAALGSFEFHRVHHQFASFKISTQKDLRNSFAEKFYVRVIRHFSTYENHTSGQTEYANIAPFNGTYQCMYACVVCWVMESNTFIKIAKLSVNWILW